ncbi:hypothetical protein N7532_000207 [Penicillium argentinense]|uniref:Uncharacterized protein n=1 Tax=Penicillium argentinense TaxID=1131581 RepID=A0A9W9G6C0_9EURO|nr:uncharacterized protein N7532_000207 [Penicillium argentinense]KAJ5112162.1 hypothetical protein N7532_000207 [Penicillium argentinense]
MYSQHISILTRMFPDSSRCPPTTIVSMNARFDLHYHAKIGATLRPLKEENYFIIGIGVYRNVWQPMVLYRDTLGQESPQKFGPGLQTGVRRHDSCPNLRLSMIRLMKHPQYRDAHATDDHFMVPVLCADVAGDWEDCATSNDLGAETWERTNMCNSQCTLGDMPLVINELPPRTGF